jgi:hypothetical protein
MKHLFSKLLGAALMSALAIGSTGQTPLAQAAQPAEPVVFSMNIKNPKTTLRCRESVLYFVSVELAPSNGAPTPAPGSRGVPRGVSMIVTNVEATSKDPSVGDFVGARTEKTTVVFDDDLVTLGSKFRFKANKPGTTTLYFEGLVGKEYVSLNLDVEVLPCNFKARTSSTFSAQGITILSAMDGEMQMDEEGSFTGTATVNWVGAPTAAGNCSGTIDIASSQADLTGSLDENGQLRAEVTYLPAALTHNFCCQGICATDTALVTPAAVAMSVPPSGGVSRQSQDLYEPRYYSMHGSVDIIVIPAEDEAISFIPGNQEGSEDDGSSSFEALLALR